MKEITSTHIGSQTDQRSPPPSTQSLKTATKGLLVTLSEQLLYFLHALPQLHCDISFPIKSLAYHGP
jgi:hypothetical protein